MTVYVAGPKGYLGQNLVPYLRSKRYRVYELGKNEVLDFRPWDVVVNLACHGHKPGHDNMHNMIQANIVYPIRLFNCLPPGATMIHAASSAEIHRPEMMYSRTKSLGTEYLMGKCHVAYIYTVFGGVAEFPHRFMQKAVRAAATGEEMRLTTPLAIRDFIHMRHILRGFEQLIESAAGPKTLHFGSGRSYTMANVVGMLKAISGKGLENIEFVYDEKGSSMWEAKPAHFPTADLRKDLEEEYRRCVSATGSPISSGEPVSTPCSASPEAGTST